MPTYSKEYAHYKGLDKWDTDLEDAFIELRHDKKKQHQGAKTKVFYCEGLEISKIRIISPFTRQVLIHGEWIAYEKIRERLSQ